MFTGIIERMVRVKAVKAQSKGIRVRIEKPRGWKLGIGQSISVDGICSTVVALSRGVFEVDYMPETLRKTTVGSITTGTRVNLERSLVYGDRIDGHFVLGHVDAVAVVTRTEQQGSSRLISVQVPSALKRYVALHGSITIQGVALTVAQRKGGICTVALIPHTLSHTTLGKFTQGDSVHIEVDYLARYGIVATGMGGTVRRNATKRIQKSPTGRRRLKA